MSSPEFVSVETKDHIATVTLDRPQALNAISGAVADELAAAFGDVAADPEVWVMVLRASGDRAFCVGADLKERAAFSLADFRANRTQMFGMFAALRGVPQPTIAAVFGYTLGGGFELALSCDLMVAAEETLLGLPEATVGLLPAGGGTQLLTRSVGEARAKELIFTGRRFDSREGEAMGLICRVAPRASVDGEALLLAAAVCKASPVAVRSAKTAIEAALGSSMAEGIERENGEWSTVVESRDRSEGIAAFNEKRPPRWNNR